MNSQQFTEILAAHSDSLLRFALPSGDYIPDHFHVTEVGRIDKNFIDCGGTRRTAAACSLQVWTANDLDHRLMAGKLAKIMRLARPILASDDLPMEIEYGAEVAAQYHVENVIQRDNQLIVALAGKQTDCLAKEQCGAGECGSSDCCR